MPQSFPTTGISFPKVMALASTFTRDPRVQSSLRDALSAVHDVAESSTLGWLALSLRERPVSVCLVDLTSMG